MGGRRDIAGRDRLAQHPAARAQHQPEHDQRHRRREQKGEARRPDRHQCEDETAPAEPRHRPSRHWRTQDAGEVGDEQQPELGRREIVGRGREMEAHIGEDRDEIEQHAEADRVDRDQLRVPDVAQHLPARRDEPFGAPEAPLARQRHHHDDRADQRNRSQHQECRPPADRLGQHAGDEAAAEAADAGAGDIDAGDARHLRRRPFVADIGERDGEDRRQHQALDEAPDDDAVDVARQRHHDGRHRDGEHRRRDQPLASEHVGDGARERRRQGDRQRGRGDHGADLGGADAELARQLRQQGLRGVEIEEGAEARNCDRETPEVDGHGFGDVRLARVICLRARYAPRRSS